MTNAETLSIGAPTLFEATMVAISRFGRGGDALVERFVADWEVEVTPFDANHCRVAVGAFARLAGAPLLFTGEDFAETDLTPALA
jgi:uncharacterized protein with PIN domain